MLRFSPTARWLITALLAVWVPVCCCEASGLAGMLLDAFAPAAEGSPCCCCVAADADPAAPSEPTDDPCNDACCELAVKMAGAQRPDLPALGPAVALPPMVAVASCCVRPAPVALAALRDVRPTPPPTLLRLHCALTV